MRKACLLCVIKHLSQALVLYHESIDGYPHHVWYALGHLAEAEAECADDVLRGNIRLERLKIPDNGGPNIDGLLQEAVRQYEESYESNLE